MARNVRRALRQEPQVLSGPEDGFELLDKYRAQLAIDRVGMDDSVANQPELFEHVADAHVLAVADRDALKLEIDEVEAETDKQIRADAARLEEKITETEIKRLITLDPDLKKLRREYLDATTRANRWSALKESFKDRSYMLRELVSLHISKLAQRGSISSAQGDLSDANRNRAGAMRTQRRFSRGEEGGGD